METTTQLGRKDTGRPLLPTGVRRALLAAVGLLLASAVYLVAVRGQALLLDLSALSQRVFCF
jgi:hypothetical protein